MDKKDIRYSYLNYFKNQIAHNQLIDVKTLIDIAGNPKIAKEVLNELVNDGLVEGVSNIQGDDNSLGIDSAESIKLTKKGIKELDSTSLLKRLIEDKKQDKEESNLLNQLMKSNNTLKPIIDNINSINLENTTLAKYLAELSKIPAISPEVFEYYNSPAFKHLAENIQEIQKTMDISDITSEDIKKQNKGTKKAPQNIKESNNDESYIFEGILGRNCGTIVPYYDSEKRLQEKGYIVENGIYVLRGYSKMSDLVGASIVDSNNYQRKEDLQHINDIKNFLQRSKICFLPEIILVARNNVKIEEIDLNLKGKQLGRFQNINYRKITVPPKSLYRVDGNHRLEAYDEKGQDYYIPFSIILWHVNEEEKQEDSKQEEKNAIDNEAFLFYLLNAKSKPLTLEENIRGIVKSDVNVWQDDNIREINFIFPYLRDIYNSLNNDIIFKKSHYLDNEGQENVWSQYLNILNEIFKKENNNKQPEEEYNISFNKEQCKEIVCNTILLLNQTTRFKYLRENYKKFPQLIFYLQYLKTQDKKNEIDIEADLEDINNWAQKYKHDDHSFENPINMYENAMRQIQRGEINIFVAMPYYNYETIKQYNSNYQKIVSTIIKKNPKLNDRLKLFPIMTHKGETKNILDDIDECIENCQIFIADVSDDPLKNNVVNPNVMYELGVARQKSKPCIIIKNAKNDSDLIFDIKPMSVYFLNFDNPDVNFVPEMVEHIEEIIKKYYIS